MAAQYMEAAEIVQAVIAGKMSLKAALYSHTRQTAVGKLMALVTQTLKYSSVLDQLAAETGLVQPGALAAVNASVIRVMLYDLLFGKHKSIVGGGAVKRMVMEHEAELRRALQLKKQSLGALTDEQLLPARLQNVIALPRYVRVNLLLTTVDAAILHFQEANWQEITCAEGLQLLSEKEKEATRWTEKRFWRDDHLSDLLVFPPSTDLHLDTWVSSGKVVLQDKASALGGACLQPPASPDTVALDACAAPGQKTVQLCQSMQNQGMLIAIEQDPVRYRTLVKLGKARGMRNLSAFNRSFLDIDPREAPFCDVEYLLLDPSCSGSGIVNRLDFSENTLEDLDESSERLKSLSEFQLSAILHAFSFPKLKRLIYSTCSIHDIENECVVMRALENAPAGWKLVPVAPPFPSRGKPLFPEGEYCIRTVPEKDRTIGFFVAAFERSRDSQHPPQDAVALGNTILPAVDASDLFLHAQVGVEPPLKKRKMSDERPVPGSTIPKPVPFLSSQAKKRRKQKPPRPVVR